MTNVLSENTATLTYNMFKIKEISLNPKEQYSKNSHHNLCTPTLQYTSQHVPAFSAIIWQQEFLHLSLLLLIYPYNGQYLYLGVITASPANVFYTKLC